MDPQRKRLSVAVVNENKGGKSAAKKAETLEDCGLVDIFKDKQAVSITSVSDQEGKRRQSFAQKDDNVLISGFDDEIQAEKALRELGIGWCCKKGMKPESPNQDSFNVLMVFGEFALYGVFDGHGPSGHDISTLARQRAVDIFINHPERATKPEVALKVAFTTTQDIIVDMMDNQGLDAATSGSTATLVYHNIAEDVLHIAHVGDSRSVLGGKKDAKAPVQVIAQTVDHKPDLPEEKKRIESSNPPGRVIFDGFYNHRVFSQKGMYPGLNMSRALGDVIAHKEAGLTAEPDVARIDLKPLREKCAGGMPLLICSDGVWEFIESEDAYKVGDLEKSQDFVNKLAKESYDKWMQDSDNEISDDITAVIVQLGNFPAVTES